LRAFASMPVNLDQIRCLGVVSDTHIPDRVRSLHPDLIPGLRKAGVEVIVHAGDICAPSVIEELSEVAPVIAVRGNRDWVFAGVLPWKRSITVGALRIAIQHGMGDFWHYWLDKFKYASVGYRFERYKRLLNKTAPDTDIHIFGHTHRGENRVEGGVLYFNPGSASLSPATWPDPSFGVLNLDGNGSVRGEHVLMRRLPVQNGSWVIDP